MVKVGILGSGWRSEFYLRAAAVIPEQIEIVGVWARRPERAAELSARYGVPTFAEKEEVLRQRPDYVVTILPWQPMHETLLELMEQGVPVLCETPPAPDIEALDALWAAYKRTNARVQVAEQYFAQPYHRAVQYIVDSGMIGAAHSIDLSMIHGYHAISIMRRLLGTGLQGATIRGRMYKDKVLATGSRYGLVKEQKPLEVNRAIAMLEFEGGALAQYNFSDEQYHSELRTRHLRLLADRGEVNDLAVRYINSEGDFMQDEITRTQRGLYSDLEGLSLRDLQLSGRVLYKNPFMEHKLGDMRRLMDDEIAIADIMVRMGWYLDTGEEFYPMAEACHDTYLSHLMNRALETGEPVSTERKPWME